MAEFVYCFIMNLKPVFIKIFCREYHINRNITRSAVTAGWSRITAESQGYKILANIGVKKRMEELEQKAVKENDGLRERVIEEYKKIAFTNVESMFTVGVDGRVEMIPVNEMTENQKGLISNMRSKVKFDNKGEKHYDFEVNIHDKMKSLEKIGHILGMFKDVQETKITSVDFHVNSQSKDDSDTETDEIPTV